MKYILLTMSFFAVYFGINMTSPAKTYYQTTQVKGVVELSPVATPIENVSVSEPRHYEHQEIADALLRAGFSQDQIPTMLAIAGGESHWRIDAIGDTNIMNKAWGASVGIFQIRTLKTADKGCRDYDQLINNLDAQASCAHQIYLTQGYKAWAAYTNKSYLKFM